jgi:hypothetical protein
VNPRFKKSDRLNKVFSDSRQPAANPGGTDPRKRAEHLVRVQVRREAPATLMSAGSSVAKQYGPKS